MIASYWPLALTVAGILGVVGQTLMAWIVILVAGLLSLLG